MPSMTTKRYFFEMIYLQGKVYAVGGAAAAVGSKSSMDIFDSTTRTWTKQSIPFSVWGHCISQLSENQFILIAGYGNGEVSKNVMKKKYFNPTISFFTFHYVKNFLQTIFFKF